MREGRRKEKVKVGKEKSRISQVFDSHGHLVKWVPSQREIQEEKQGVEP